MRKNKIKEMWSRGEPAAIGWVGSGNPYITEVMAHTGFDGIVVDMQHGMGVTADMAVACLQVISTTDTVPLARVPWNKPEWIQYMLDAGAMGVVIPMVNTAEEAAKAVGACRYAPQGYRSVGPNRAVLYAGSDYIDHANEEIICLAMIETQQAIDNLEEMARVPGLDGFYIGPADLATSLGVPIAEWTTNEKHLRACQRVLDVANAAGIIPGHHSAGGAHTAEMFKQGFKFCYVCNDGRLLAVAAAEALKATKDAM